MAPNSSSDSIEEESSSVSHSVSNTGAAQPTFQFISMSFPNPPTNSPSPAAGTVATSSTGASSVNAISTFGGRFQVKNKPCVSYRKAPDLTSDPGQIFAPMTNVSKDFHNTTMNSNQHAPAPATGRDNTNEDDGPKAKRRKLKPNRAKIASNRSQQLPDELWEIIFSNAHPRVLLAMQNVCWRTRSILQSDKVWKRARLQVMGDDAPGPLPGLNERQFNELLHGQGCAFQNSVCGRTVTRKVYWPFMLRLCDDCFLERTQKACKCIISMSFTDFLSGRICRRFDGQVYVRRLAHCRWRDAGTEVCGNKYNTSRWELDTHELR